jgi:hypothetical protein
MISFLYVIILSGGSSTDQIRRFEFPNQEACLKSLKSIKLDNKKDAIFTAFCANEKSQRNYNATWWFDPVKDAK